MASKLSTRLLHLSRRRNPITAAVSSSLPIRIRTFASRSSAFDDSPSPPRLPPDQQAEFERLLRQASTQEPLSAADPAHLDQPINPTQSSKPYHIASDPFAPANAATVRTQSQSSSSSSPSGNGSGSSPHLTGDQSHNPTAGTEANRKTQNRESPDESAITDGTSPGQKAALRHGTGAAQQEIPGGGSGSGNRARTVPGSAEGSGGDSARERAEGIGNVPLRKGAPPEFEGDTNPRTGEVGGPKVEPLRWGAVGDWSYNGRVTDF